LAFSVNNFENPSQDREEKWGMAAEERKQARKIPKRATVESKRTLFIQNSAVEVIKLAEGEPGCLLQNCQPQSSWPGLWTLAPHEWQAIFVALSAFLPLTCLLNTF
jgi:hypothetical protein